MQKITGISFDQYCYQNLFYPLEMDRASWFLAGMDTNNIATPYDWIGGQYVPLCHSSWPIYPVAQLRTNKLELLHFLSTYMNHGIYNGVTILNDSTVDLMLTVHKQVGTYDNWGLMWHNAILNNRSLWGHTGAWYGGATAMFFYPEEDWGIIVLYNRYPGNAYWQIIGSVCEYAHMFGDIYAVNTTLDKPYISVKNLMQMISSNKGFTMPSLVVPLSIAVGIGKIFDLLSAILKKDIPINSDRMRKFATSTEYYSDKIREDGYIQQHSIEDQLTEAVKWFLANQHRRAELDIH